MAGRKSIYRSKRTGEEKVITTVVLPRDLFERVERAAYEAYGLHRGSLSLAVREALEAWLQARAGARSPNPRPDVREAYNKVLDSVEAKLGAVPISVPQHVFEAAIADALNIKDRRSIIGWMHRFYVAGLIKPLTVDVREEADWRRNKAIELVARRA